MKQPAGKWGSVANCDIPLRTFESALRHIRKHEKVRIRYDYFNILHNS